jgi:hypothetical protein
MALRVLDSTLPFDELTDQAWSCVAELIPTAAT